MGKVTIIIPVHNEEQFFSRVFKKVIYSKTEGYQKEIIVVNDGSTDSSLGEINKNKKKYSKKSVIIKTISYKKRSGKGTAIKKALTKATGDLILIQDADLEVDPKDFPGLLSKFRDDTLDVVYGSRVRGIFAFGNKFPSLLYLVGGIVLSIVVDVLFGVFLTDQATCYKVFKRKCIPFLLKAKENGFEYEVAMTAIFAKNKYKIYEVPISYFPRKIEDGKKIRLYDFVESLKTAFTYKFK